MLKEVTHLAKWVRVQVWGAVPPMPRPRVNRRGGVGMPARYRARLRSIAQQIAEACKDWDPPAVRVYVIVRKPQSPTSRGFGDADNLAKTVLEALPFDDCRVVDLQVVKRWSIAPSADILIQEVDYGYG
jgi:Holliday junction resolvase RusA-like endonuclease